MDTSKIVQEARTWIDTPFHHQGRLKGVGVDCLGLVICIFNALGAKLVDKAAYPRYPSGGLLMAGIRSQCIEIDISDAKTGDIFVSAERHQPNHVMIYDAETDTVIHSYYQNEKVTEHQRELMATKIIGAFRYEW